MEKIVLVDLNDNPIGSEEKQYVHEKALLHRAFSILLFNKDKVYIQQRALSKYHCAGLWANTCCSHQRDYESFDEAVRRCLLHEVGLTCDVKEIGRFLYRASFPNGLTEYEMDHVLIGEYDGEISFNPEEIEQCKCVEIEWLKEDMRLHSEIYAPWFFTVFDLALQYKMKR